MKLFPSGKWARLRLCALVAVLLWAVLHFHVYGLAHLLVYHPQEGDVVFQSLPRGSLVDAIEGISGSPYSHCGVVMRNANGRWAVVEAIGRVRETPLYLWIVRGRGARLDVWRWKDMPDKSPAPLRDALAAHMGKPYDYHYAEGERAIYCSELVFLAYRKAYGIALGEWRPLGELNWRPHEAFIRAMENGRLPLDRKMITPVGLTVNTELAKAY